MPFLFNFFSVITTEICLFLDNCSSSLSCFDSDRTLSNRAVCFQCGDNIQEPTWQIHSITTDSVFIAHTIANTRRTPSCFLLAIVFFIFVFSCGTSFYLFVPHIDATECRSRVHNKCTNEHRTMFFCIRMLPYFQPMCFKLGGKKRKK